MNSPLQKFTHLGKSVILLPGSRFTKNELNSRLHQMDVQYDQSSLSKKYFIDLYENALKYDVNKIKIFDRLIKDTIRYNEMQNKKIKVNQSNIDISTNNSPQKIAMLENNIINQDNFKNNNYQNINSYNNNQNYKYENNFNNNYNNNNYNQKQNNDWNNKNNQKNNYYENNNIQNNNQNNNQYAFKESILNEIKKSQNEIVNKNQNQNNNYNFNEQQKYNYIKGQNAINQNIRYNENNNKYTNNYNNINNANYDNEIKNNYNSHFNYNQKNYNPEQGQNLNNNNNQNNYYNQSQNNQNYQNYNMNQNYNNNYQQNNYNNKNNYPQLEYNNENQKNEINNINTYQSNNNNIKYERKNCVMEQDESQYENYNTNQYKNNNNNNKNVISLSIQNAINDNNTPQIEPNTNKSQYNPIITNRKEIITYDNPKIYEPEEDVDTHSNFSITSKFDRIKNYFENKENRDFCFNILQIIIVGIIFLVIFSYGLRFSHSIRESVTETAKTIVNPRKLLTDIIWGIIKGIIVGILWKYIFVTIPLAMIALVVYFSKKKYDFKQICKKIIEEIKNDLRNKPLDENGRKSMSEKEINLKYSKKYKIDYNTFVKIYLKELNELRKKDHSLKQSQMIGTQGIYETRWELNE